MKSRAAGSEPSVSSIRTATDVRLEKELNNKTRSGVEWVAELFLTGELMDRMEIDMKPYSEIKFSEVCLPDAAMLRSVLEILHEVEGKVSKNTIISFFFPFRSDLARLFTRGAT